MTTSRTLLPTMLALALSVACGGVDSRGKEAAPPIQLAGDKAYEAGSTIELAKTPPKDMPGLHNVYHLGDRIVSGSEPHGEEAFKALQGLGVRTILSVDGKAPDQEMAKKYGMSYVHVPIQYRGMTDEELLQITKIFRDKDGPFYVHCFHGKHRGPAAAAVGRLVIDGVPREQALAEMRQWCGTSASYDGLYRVIATAPVPSRAKTDAYAWDFPAAHAFDGLRQAMIEVARWDDNVKLLQKHKWQPDEEHPDLDALNEATKLADSLAQGAKQEEVASKPADFRGWIQDSVKSSAELRDAIAAWRKGSGDAAAADAAYKRVATSCNACHAVYRN